MGPELAAEALLTMSAALPSVPKRKTKSSDPEANAKRCKRNRDKKANELQELRRQVIALQDQLEEERIASAKVIQALQDQIQERIASIQDLRFQPNDLSSGHHYDTIDRPLMITSISSTLTSPSASSSLSSSIQIPISSTPMQNPDPPRAFGIARDDINVIKKKFEWIEEEISCLRQYINSIEPQLLGTSKN